MKIGYICTNYNNSHYTECAVASLVRACPSGCRVVVVDNNSDSESVEHLKAMARRFACVDLILSPENVGYFAGLNLGIRYMREQDPSIRFIVIGNNDLSFPEDFGAAMQRENYVLEQNVVVSPDVVTLDGLHQNPHVIRPIGSFREIIYDIYHYSFLAARIVLLVSKVLGRFAKRRDSDAWKQPMSIYQGHGSCYILGPRFFDYFQALWAPTFLFGEEFFLTKQLSDEGLSVYYAPSISVVHHCHAAIDKMPKRKMWVYSRTAHRVYRRYVRIFSPKRK